MSDQHCKAKRSNQTIVVAITKRITIFLLKFPIEKYLVAIFIDILLEWAKGNNISAFIRRIKIRKLFNISMRIYYSSCVFSLS